MMALAKKLENCGVPLLPVIDIVVADELSSCLFTTHAEKREGELYKVGIIGFVPVEFHKVEVVISAIPPDNFIEQDSTGFKIVEYGHTIPHIDGMGGDVSVTSYLAEMVTEKLKHEEVVEAVYLYVENGTTNFLIITKIHDPNVNLQLSDIYWDISDQCDQKFEFKPIPTEYFEKFVLPEDSVKILGR